MKQAIELSAQRGTSVWGVNRLRSDALSMLLDDLMFRQETGIHDNQCVQVKLALGHLVNQATAIPDSRGFWWKTTIWEELQEFLDIYEKWNSHYGDEAEAVTKRKEALRQLRHRRNRIATKIRKNQYIIQSELDLELVEDMYGALGDLAKAFPEIFKNLAGAVARFRAGIDEKD